MSELSIRALLFTDIEGSTALLQRLGGLYSAVLERHHEIIRLAAAAWSGAEQSREGDSLFVTFPSATAALEAAVDAQRRIERERWPPYGRVRVRMGLHIGEVAETRAGLVGLAIHQAARIAAAAHGGQIVVSPDIVSYAVPLPAAVGLRPVGRHELRDVGPVVLYQVEHPDLQAEFPPLRTRRAADGARMLEREAALGLLADAMDDAAAGRGRVVLVSGEAGIGKTALVRAFLSANEGVRVLFGTCDNLVTPLPLGPLRDVAGRAGPAFAEALESPPAGGLQRVLLAELGREPSPGVLVVDDAQWGDEATIDLLTFASRRIAQVPALIVLTYREEEVAGSHPLVPLLGNIPVDVTRRVALRPLSLAAVAALVGPERAAAVRAVTGGVPFFVTELAAMGPGAEGEQLPRSVAHAVRARVAKLPKRQRVCCSISLR